jgi:hypothetical protein
MVLHHSHDEQPFYVLVAGCLKKNILLCSYFWEGSWMQNEMEYLQRSAPVFEKHHGSRRKWSTCKSLHGIL